MDPAEYAALYAQEEKLWWFAGMRGIVATMLEGRTRPGMQVLDAGCGAGFNALHLALRYDWRVFACDYSQHALAFSAKRGVPRLAAADIARLPYADASFDGVTCFDVLVMFGPDRIGAALTEFHRVLRPRGLLVVRVAALEMLRGRHSQLNAEARRYSLPELREHIAAAGFAIEQATYANAMLMPLALVKRRVLEPLGIGGEGSDVAPVPAWMNRLFLAAMGMDRRLIAAGVPLPFGTSAIVVGRKL